MPPPKNKPTLSDRIRQKGNDMRGVTDPRILLKADDQRIDKNVYTPEQAMVNRKFWAARQKA